MAWTAALAAAVTAGVAVGRRRRALRDAQDRLAAARTAQAALRHDLRGLLSPALMVVDPLLEHGEPKVRRVGEIVVRSVARAVERLEK